MPTSRHQSASILQTIAARTSVEDVKLRLRPESSPQNRPPSGNTSEALAQRWQLSSLKDDLRESLGQSSAQKDLVVYKKNIENFLGTIKLPLGLAGPLRVNGLFAKGDYLIPMATTEAALVASYNRGTKVISDAGGCTCVMIKAIVSRTPCFEFSGVAECGEFLIWLDTCFEELKKIAESTTRFGKLIDLRYALAGRRVFLCFDFETGDASGQNMVTIATQAVFDHIRKISPVQPRRAFIKGNMSGDKKASFLSFQNSRGRNVISEVVIPKASVIKNLQTDVDTLVDYATTSSVGATLSGCIGWQGHYANALAALYLATGQDVACVSESSVGMTRFEKTEQGDLYVSVSLPNLMVGTVGGGTGLPSQNACLNLMNLAGAGQANALAEVIAGVCLAGEISITAAMCSDTFTHAHKSLARND